MFAINLSYFEIYRINEPKSRKFLNLLLKQVLSIIKYMSISNLLLTEVYSRQPLYHFTPLPNMLKILIENKLRRSLDSAYISFTRRFDLSIEYEHFGDCRITFDTEKLKSKYKLEKFDWYSDSHITDYRRNEAEERIKIKEINQIKNYIIGVDVEYVEYVNKDYYRDIPFVLKEYELIDYISPEDIEGNLRDFLIKEIEALLPTNIKMRVDNKWRPFRK